VQATRTAETGTVAQPVKYAEPAATESVHLLVFEPPPTKKKTVVPLPAPAPESGSLAEKLRLFGNANIHCTLAASGSAWTTAARGAFLS
jgi:hypothetical protein